MSARMKKWNGDEIRKSVVMNMEKALGEFGLRVEGYAKKELVKGHGVITGTLRRSLHTARPGYNWSGDDVPRTKRKVRKGVVIQEGSPERGGQAVDATAVGGGRITVEVGSGLVYALAVHQGHHSFDGYHFLTNGLEKAKPEMPIVLSRHRLK